MAAVAAVEMGHANVKVYEGGLPDWMARGYPVRSGQAQAAR